MDIYPLSKITATIGTKKILMMLKFVRVSGCEKFMKLKRFTIFDTKWVNQVNGFKFLMFSASCCLLFVVVYSLCALCL